MVAKIGKYVKSTPSGYSKEIRKKMETKHPDGNWKFDNVGYYPRGVKKITKNVMKRVAVFCPHCGVKGWRAFRFLERNLIALDTGQQCRSIECWHCEKIFILSVKCTKDCKERLHCFNEGVTHPQLKVPVNDAVD
jgi:hypothetical protein